MASQSSCPAECDDEDEDEGIAEDQSTDDGLPVDRCGLTEAIIKAGTSKQAADLVDAAQLALSCEVNVIADVDSQQTPVHLALRYGLSSVVELLVARGASRSAIDSDGKNMLHFAAASGDIKLVAMVQRWDYLANFQWKGHFVEEPEAFAAAGSGSLPCLAYLLSHPPSTAAWRRTRDWDGKLGYVLNPDPLQHSSSHGTVFHAAARSRKVELMAWLVNTARQKHTSKDALQRLLSSKDELSMTPLTLAQANKDHAMLAYLAGLDAWLKQPSPAADE